LSRRAVAGATTAPARQPSMVHAMPARLQRLWPLPALLAWSVGWAAFLLLRLLGCPLPLAFAAASMLGAALAASAATPWRRFFVAGGFPLSLVAAGLAGPLPAWIWLLPLGVLLLAYPARAWRDAPLFPTPAGALAGLAGAVPLADGARVLDAGCGLGAGLAELRRAYPDVVLEGIEWSAPFAFVCAWRRRDARVRRADLWAAPWHGYDLVYLFQRPESLPRAIAKAGAEMRPGTWLASLEFEAPGRHADHVLRCPDGRPLWLYRLPLS
jgi:hypothetical protein